MTIPESLDLPIHGDDIQGDKKDLQKYIEELVKTLEESHESITSTLNGQYRTSDSVDNQKWEPVLYGTGTAGVGTYTHQVGWSIRQGLLVDLYFDVLWKGHTGVGNIYIELPYVVASSAGKPFVGVVQAANVAWGAGRYIICNAIPDTTRCEIWSSGTGSNTANVAVSFAGQYIGHIRYIGKQFE